MENPNQIFENDHYNEDLPFQAALSSENLLLNVPNELAGMRLDAALAKMLPDYSRSRITTWIKDGLVLCNNQEASPKDKLIGGEELHIQIQQSDENQAFEPELMDLDIVFEDDAVIVLNKPAGLVVHPAAGNWTGTLLNGLLAHCPELSQVPRAGIVHRLDKDTSGLMVVAKTLPVQNHLVQQLQNRSVKRIYRAVADGVVPFDGKIETLIGRDPHNRLKMAVVKFGGKEAITHVKVLERYQSHSYIECSLETGRTHQIRVAVQSRGHGIAGDDKYGKRDFNRAIRRLGFKGMFLHAASTRFVYDDRPVAVSAPLPATAAQLLTTLDKESA